MSWLDENPEADADEIKEKHENVDNFCAVLASRYYADQKPKEEEPIEQKPKEEEPKEESEIRRVIEDFREKMLMLSR